MSIPSEKRMVLVGKQTGPSEGNEAVGWFDYVTGLTDPNELKAQAMKLIGKVLKDEYSKFEEWSGEWRYQPLPFLRYVNRDCPFIEFKVDLYIAAKVEVQLNYYDKKQIEFIKPLKTEMEKFRVPIAFFNAIADGDLKKLSQIRVVERDCYYVTLDIPGFGETKLKDSLITSFRDFFRGKRVGQALAKAGLLPLDAADLIDARPAHALLPLKTSQEISAGTISIDNGDVIAALETLGYKPKEIHKGVASAGLNPSMSTEEKLQAVLKNMNI